MESALKTREELKTFLAKLLTSSDLVPQGRKTFCNVALRRTALWFGYDKIPKDMLMNDIILRIKRDVDFLPVSGGAANNAAITGKWAMALHAYDEHGHGATIYPMEKMGVSGKWGNVPYVANIGKSNGIMKVSDAFPVNNTEPDYFVWNP